MKELGIIIPIYKEILEKNEEICFLRILNKITRYPIFLIAPDSLDTEWYESKGGFNIIRFKDKYFKSERTYTKLLLTQKFYNVFSNYEYILIIQTDVWIIQSDYVLKAFIDYGYDYIGAPWKDGIDAYAYTMKGISYLPSFLSQKRKMYVGNGGLSLRKVQSHIKLLKRYRIQRWLWSNVGEDIFFSYYGQKDTDFIIAPVEIAQTFSLETSAREDIKKGIIPFGVHAWEKFYPEIKTLKS